MINRRTSGGHLRTAPASLLRRAVSGDPLGRRHDRPSSHSNVKASDDPIILAILCVSKG